MHVRVLFSFPLKESTEFVTFSVSALLVKLLERLSQMNIKKSNGIRQKEITRQY
jgi:hypothetical protein